MRIKLTETQYKELEELLSVDDDYNDPDVIGSKTREQMKWMDYRGPELKGISNMTIDYALKQTINFYIKKYPNLKRVVVKDDGNDVGFLVFARTTEKIEDISEDESVMYSVLLSTAIHPNYRKQGLLKQMIERANIKKPFIVHTSLISTPEVWERIGCKPVKDLGGGNKINMCR